MASLNGTLTIRPNTTITDDAGNSWYFQNGQVYENGIVDGLTNRVIAIGIIDGHVVQQNTDNLWWAKTNQGYDGWGTPGYDDGHIANPFPASTSGKTIVPDGASPIVDGSGNLWWIDGGRVVENGITDQFTANVVKIAYVNGQIYQENNQLLWWQKTYQGWGGWGTPGNPDGHIDTPALTTSWTWAGGGDNSASDPAHWSPGSLPQPGGTITMNSGVMNVSDDALNGTTVTIAGMWAPTPPTATINLFGEEHLSIADSFPHPTGGTVNLSANSHWVGGFSSNYYGPGFLVQGEGKFENTWSSAGNQSAIVGVDVIGSGTFEVSSYRGSGRLEFTKSVSPGQEINVYTGIYYAHGYAYSQLLVDQPTAFQGSVSLGYGEMTLKGLVADSFSFRNDLLSLFRDGSAIDSVRLKLDANLAYDTSGASGATAFGVSQVGGDVVIHADGALSGRSWGSGTLWRTWGRGVSASLKE